MTQQFFDDVSDSKEENFSSLRSKITANLTARLNFYFPVKKMMMSLITKKWFAIINRLLIRKSKRKKIIQS